jgi:antirestriction protein ArdC
VSEPYRPRWAELLIEAVNRPGLILEGYSWFHKYSIGNQIAVLWQCRRRGIEPGPIATFWQWQELGRRVKAGQRALHLRMPVIVREKRNAESPNRPGPLARRMIFVWKANWFVLSQTDGKPYQADRRPDWSKDRALVTLNVEEIPFTLLDGNTQGYTEGRKIAINPIAKLPWKTLFHELGHVLLEHTAQAATADGEHLPKNLREAEAEAVALICCDSLQLPGAEYCRGYIQDWLGRENPIPEESAARVFKAADNVLKAGSSPRTQEGDSVS